MILSGKEILQNIGEKIIIEPFSEKRLGPNSYNLRLHEKLLTYEAGVLDMKQKPKTNAIIIPEDGFIVEPGKLYLGRTVEYTETHGFVPMLEGRSSVGRLGLFIHVTAGFGDVGFSGYWTLEITAIRPIRVYPNTEVGQIFYHQISDNHVEYTSDKYQKNKGVQGSLLYKEFLEDS